MLADMHCAPGAHGFFWFPLIPLFFFGFWILVLFIVRPWAWRQRGWSPSGSAEAVLAERYARGEVTEEEYRARLEVLRTRR